ncbi:HopJ type III effector protein [Shewanella olleyana]|nr:HopJ type III effector protein [Shewanella olleyana]
MAVIEANYSYTPSAFTNGAQNNAEGENAGSCKVFAFGTLHQLNEQQTLSLFGQHYRDVVATPEGNDHQNIRQFMQNGWEGISFSQEPLALKA